MYDSDTKENRELRKSYDEIFRIAGEKAGLSKLTYNTYVGLGENDRRKVKVDKIITNLIEHYNDQDIYFDDSYGNYDEYEKHLKTINDNARKEDKVADAKTFFELGEKLFPKPKRQEKTSTNNASNENSSKQNEEQEPEIDQEQEDFQDEFEETEEYEGLKFKKKKKKQKWIEDIKDIITAKGTLKKKLKAAGLVTLRAIGGVGITASIISLAITALGVGMGMYLSWPTATIMMVVKYFGLIIPGISLSVPVGVMIFKIIKKLRKEHKIGKKVNINKVSKEVEKEMEKTASKGNEKAKETQKENTKAETKEIEEPIDYPLPDEYDDEFDYIPEELEHEQLNSLPEKFENKQPNMEEERKDNSLEFSPIRKVMINEARANISSLGQSKEKIASEKEELIKLKEYLNKRYQGSSEEELKQKRIYSDLVSDISKANIDLERKEQLLQEVNQSLTRLETTPEVKREEPVTEQKVTTKDGSTKTIYFAEPSYAVRETKEYDLDKSSHRR